MRGPFPFGAAQPVTDKLVSDAKLLLSLSDEQFQLLQSELRNCSGFLSKVGLISILSRFLPEPALATRAATFILAIEERKRVHHYKVRDFADEVGEWQREQSTEENHPPVLSSDDLELARSRFPVLFASLPGLELQAKALNLAERIGQPLERIEIICDLRPVFDANRENVEAMIPVTTLRLVCKSADGLPVAFDAVLSERDVHALARASSDAKKKLSRLREVMETCKIAVPEMAVPNDEETRRDEGE
jgi:hypothetical protein